MKKVLAKLFRGVVISMSMYLSKIFFRVYVGSESSRQGFGLETLFEN